MRPALTSLLLFCFVTAAFAQGAPNGPKRAPCAPFVHRYCENVPIGKGRRLNCLAQHKAQLNSECRETLKAMQDVFAFGKKQHELTQKALEKQAAKEKAEVAKKGTSASPPPANKPDGGK